MRLRRNQTPCRLSGITLLQFFSFLFIKVCCHLHGFCSSRSHSNMLHLRPWLLSRQRPQKSGVHIFELEVAQLAPSSGERCKQPCEGLFPTTRLTWYVCQIANCSNDKYICCDGARPPSWTQRYVSATAQMELRLSHFEECRAGNTPHNYSHVSRSHNSSHTT